MATIQPPPTYALPILVDEKTGKAQFHPLWLKWFVELAATLSGFGGTVPQHNLLGGLQGGSASQYYHLTGAQHSSLLALPTLAQGTYTPTLTNVANLSASGANVCQYLQVGSMVVVSGSVTADPTAAGSVQLGISLPVVSNLANANECGGVAFSPAVAGQGAAILGDAANNRAEMQWVAVDTTNQAMYFTFAYRVI